MIEALWYKKLRMNGIALDGPANGFVDHESMVFNTIIPTLCIKKKKHNSTDFHKTRGSVVNSRASDENMTRASKRKISLRTKGLSGPHHKKIMTQILH